MLARRKPFDGETESHVIVAILDHHPAGLKGGSRVASGLARIADKALAKHPDKRYPNAGEMLSALKALEVSSQSGTSRIVAAALAKRHHRRSRWLAAASLLCILAVALTLWWWPFQAVKSSSAPTGSHYLITKSDASRRFEFGDLVA